MYSRCWASKARERLVQQQDQRFNDLRDVAADVPVLPLFVERYGARARLKTGDLVVQDFLHETVPVFDLSAGSRSDPDQLTAITATVEPTAKIGIGR